MSTSMLKVGFVALILLILLLGLNMLREPNRQADELTQQQTEAIARARELYAANCVECHGASGEGLNEALPLNAPSVRAQSNSELFKTIARGRPGTAMVAFSTNENGILTTPQINDLITLIKVARWREIEAYIDANNLRPVELPAIEAQIDIENLSYPLETVMEGRTIYQGNCFSCHNVGAAGVTGHRIGRGLSENTFVREHTDDELLQFIKDGRAETDPDNTTGYEMPARGGNPNLTDDDLLKVIAYVREVNNKTVIDSAAAAVQTSVVWHDTVYEWVKVADNFDIPLGLFHAGDGSGRLFVVEQVGTILVIQGGQVLAEPFLDISALLPDSVYHGVYTEQGLLGLAFHPDYRENGIFFVSYTDRQGDSVLARYHVSADDPNRADPASAVTLLTVDQPFEDHNGGNLAFGPDGYLYMGFGDGGRPAEPNYYSQQPGLYLGKMVRLDVNAETYRVPDDNPFLDDPAYVPEAWATGLRNPWRFSFDRATGDLYIADVGQWRYEEVNFQPANSKGGQNYGWSAFEASHPYLEDETVLGEHTPPILEYGHEAGLSITGGYVYRGPTLTELDGLYFYGDYMNGMVWVAHRDAEGVWQSETFMDTPFVISSFGEDKQGELYLVDYKGAVYRLEYAAEQPQPTTD
ncbi:MAG: PQQ-dependent sugar dehydrogenase [Anaerolineae bacterium]|nr:PQQ-dependent sugar dehydrogenase [Anaerolineae bacterium]